MKLLSTILLLASFSVIAEEKEEEDVCESLHGLAQEIMNARQKNVPMPKLVNALQSVEGKEAKFSVLLAKMAYKEPRFSTELHQNNAINDFANDVYLMCLNKKEQSNGN